jgi:hypothetical protein
MTPIYVDVVPLLTPVLLAVAFFLVSASGVSAWLAWKDATAPQPRLRGEDGRVRPLRRERLAH